ncbi:MAG: methionyl-tRNA formyltransferase [Dehalococcoidia bacterium]
MTRVVFMGSPAFAVPSLRALVAAGYDVVQAVTQPDRPAGRGGKLAPPDVKLAALEFAIPTLQPETLKDEPVRQALRDLHPDLFVVAAYGKILGRPVLDIPKRGCINVHASLLPRWRGASPITAAILAGDAEAGVSIMEMALKMDAGGVISQRAVPIAPTDTTGRLEPRLAEAGAALLVETLPGWLDGSLPAIAQDASLVTECWQIRKDDGRLRATMTAHEAERAVRAYSPWPGASVTYEGARLAIWRAEVALADADAQPGALSVVNRCPAVAFRDGRLVLRELQRPGGRILTGEQFLAGTRGQLPGAVELL